MTYVLKKYEDINMIKVNDKSKLKSYYDFLTPLETHRDNSLADTLAVYILDANQSVSKTAALTFSHTNTVQYRLRKSKELLNIDLSDMSKIMFVAHALAIRRILQTM